MAKVTIVNVVIGVDIPASLEEIDEVMQRFTIRALKKWLRAGTMAVPVWSGAARASFIKLAVQARTNIPIRPVAPDPPGDRTALGRQTSEGKVFMNKGDFYGWEWQSNLDYISIVERDNQFIERANTAIEGLAPRLPSPTLKNKRKVTV